MSFLDNVKKREAEKRRRQDEIQTKMPAWIQAVTQLCNFIRRRVQPEAARPNEDVLVRAQPRDCRVDGFQLDALAITYEAEGKTVIVTPMSLSDSKAQGAAGCVVIEGQGQTYHLLWDGKSQAVLEHWLIVKSTRRSSKPKPLTEATLDEALDRLFGFVLESP